MRILRAALIFLSALSPIAAMAQSTVLQGGAWTPGHVPQYSTYGSQPVVIDGGGSGGGAIGQNLSELGIVSRSPTNTYPSANSGNGPHGEHGCLYDAPITNATGFHYLCFDPNALGGGLISYGAGGGAAVGTLAFNLNGATYYPASVNTLVLPAYSLAGNPTGSVTPPAVVQSTQDVINALQQPLNNAGGLLGYSLIGTPQGQYSAITGLGSAANYATGTSGAAVCLLNSSCYWNGTQTVNNLVIGTQGFNGAGGASITAPYHADWTTLTSSLWQNSIQWQIQANAPSGYAHCSAPGSSGVVILDTGSPFSADMVERTAFYLADLTVTRTVYKVASVQSASQLTLATNCQGAGSMAYFFVTETNDGVVNVNGSAVTLVSGQPFISYTTGINQWKINGSYYTCSGITQTSATCNTSGTMTNVAYHTDNNDYDTLSLLRIQTGLSEGASVSYSGENLAVIARAIGEYDFQAQSNGVGSAWPIFIMSGNYALAGNQYTQLGVYPTGTLTLGGRFGYDVVRIAPGAAGVGSNYFYASMAPSGFGPSWACRSNVGDVSVSCGIDTYGTGATIFTSHSFGAREFVIYGGGGVDHLTTYSSTGQGVLAAEGASADVNINLVPKGAGTLSISGSPGVSCPAGTVNLTTFTVFEGIVTHC